MLLKGKLLSTWGVFVLLKVYSHWGKVAAVLALANANVANVASVNAA